MLGCTAAAQDHRLRILTSIPPIYSWALNVAGTNAEVENLLPADVGPHEFQFRPRDLRKIRTADIILLNGLGLESSFARTIVASEPGAAGKVIEISATIPTNLLIFEVPTLHLAEGESEPHSHHGEANPHLWLDPVFARFVVTNLLEVFQKADPAHADAYAANARQYLDRLAALDLEIRSTLSLLTRRDVVTFHDAFPYFCRRYGLNLVGVVEEVPGASPAPRYLAALSAVIRNKQVGVLFTEPQFDPRLARQLSRDLKIAVAQLDTLETGRLSASSYEEGMRMNLRVLASSLK